MVSKTFIEGAKLGVLVRLVRIDLMGEVAIFYDFNLTKTSSSSVTGILSVKLS